MARVTLVVRPRIVVATGFLSQVILGLIGLVAVGAFLYPFFSPPTNQGFLASAHATDAPLVFSLLMILLLAVMLCELEAKRMNSKMVAVLGLLVAINSVLRVLPSFLGLSPLFFLLILVGYQYGATFGFLLGSLSLLVSAIFTGGVGPWLPFEMFGAGWVGMTAGWLPKLRRDSLRPSKGELAMLAAFGVGWGLLYGAILNLWFWPFTGLAQAPAGPGELLSRYLLFYLSISLPYDLFRSAGNALFILAFGAAILSVLRRFQRRFNFQVS